MKFILFCLNDYAFSILDPIKHVLLKKNYEFIWYVAPKIKSNFPYKTDNYTSSYSELKLYKSDVIFAPGNEVPYFLRGLKTQVFHGLAGEKKGHFRIRQYFDLYLTQGPYFTDRFLKLKKKHETFDIIETGWPKLDKYYRKNDEFNAERLNLISEHKSKYIILYAPTFSPRLTSAPHVYNEIESLAKNQDYIILLKFHPLMDEKWVKKYQNIADKHKNIIFKKEKDITKYIIISDLIISDTSSVVYEFLLLDKPAITFRNISKSIFWKNLNNYDNLVNEVSKILKKDRHSNSRREMIKKYHPYVDGKSALRMVEAVEGYLSVNQVPERRKISTFRKIKTVYKIIAKKI